MDLSIQVIASELLPKTMRDEICALCTDAYGEDFSSYLEDIGAGVHVVARRGDEMVSHAMWVTRWLEPGGHRVLRTAYVEAVATRPRHQRRGFASAVMRATAEAMRGYDLGALSPSEERFYTRLGWETWRGPLFIRRGDRLEPTPDETVMIRRLPHTPADLDLGAGLSAEWRPGEVW